MTLFSYLFCLVGDRDIFVTKKDWFDKLDSHSDSEIVLSKAEELEISLRRESPPIL